MSLSDKLSRNFYSEAQDHAYHTHKDDRTAYRVALRAIKDEFRSDLEFEYGVRSKTTGELVIPSKKADRLFEISWENGHSAGYSDVDTAYSELVELVF